MCYYFAYGSNLLNSRIRRRCPEHRVVGVAVLEDFAFVIGASGFATIRAGAGRRVMGVLYQISAVDEVRLDRCEAVDKGVYRRAEVTVHWEGRRIKALVYIDDRSTPSVPRKGYLEGIVAGARSHNLPEGYVAELEGWRFGKAG